MPTFPAVTIVAGGRSCPQSRSPRRGKWGRSKPALGMRQEPTL